MGVLVPARLCPTCPAREALPSSLGKTLATAHIRKMRTDPNPTLTPSPSGATPSPAGKKPDTAMPPEIGGPKGPEPTRYGDWERNGRCSDF